MPIYRFLQNVPMGSDEISRMSAAFDGTLHAVGIVDRNDPMTEMIARKIIELAQMGVRDPTEISARAIRELGM